MKFHCRHTGYAYLTLSCCGKRTKSIQVVPISSAGRRTSLLAWQSLFQPLSVCVCVSACYRERRRERASSAAEFRKL